MGFFGYTAAEGQQCYDLLSHVAPLTAGALKGCTLHARLGLPPASQVVDNKHI